MKEIIKIYKKSVDKNLIDISSILKKLGIKNPEVILSCRSILKLSSENITKKWLSGKKYVRTGFVREAFSDFYPKKYIEISMLIDAMINILDDLIDEQIDNKEKFLYIVELLRIFSSYSLNKQEKKIQTVVGHCFNKLISLAVAEDVYRKMITKEKRIEKIIDYSIETFNCRSMDIDVFNEIALIDYKGDSMAKKIKEIGRIFRAVNILKKDIGDIEYDRKKGMETIITHMAARKDYYFSKYIKNLLSHFLDEADKTRLSAKSLNIKIKTPINNYYKMIERDKAKIIRTLSNNC